MRLRPALILAVMALAAALSGLSACQTAFTGKAESLSIGSAPLESSALIYIADNQGLFASNGIEATIRDYDTGAASLDGLVKGEVDLAVPAEYALVGKAFNKDKIRALASIDKVQYFYLVARKDQGIASIPDLKGRKIGVVRKTIAEFYLGRWLELHGMTAGQVTLVDVNIAQSEAKISAGDVDAIISRPPYISPIEASLGPNALVWQAQSNQALYALLIGRNDWITDHTELVRRLYRALIQAEEYLIRHSADAKAIVQKRLKLDDDYMAAVWSQNHFSLSLDQSLVLAMEDEARWMIKNDLTAEKQVPNFLDYIYEDGLESVKPEAVNVIR
jgi:ABC-type nitrate/sulfonate/bicarbonate transport system substrate-binding protein